MIQNSVLASPRSCSDPLRPLWGWCCWRSQAGGLWHNRTEQSRTQKQNKDLCQAESKCRHRAETLSDSIMHFLNVKMVCFACGTSFEVFNEKNRGQRQSNWVLLNNLLFFFKIYLRLLCCICVYVCWCVYVCNMAGIGKWPINVLNRMLCLTSEPPGVVLCLTGWRCSVLPHCWRTA